MNQNNITDESIKAFLKPRSKEAPENPWFTKKVLNRLPEKERKSYNWINTIIYITSLIGCFIVWGLFVKEDLLNITTQGLNNADFGKTALFGSMIVAVTSFVIYKITATLRTE